MSPWGRTLQDGTPSLLHPGRGERWIWSGGSPRVDDGARVWSLGADAVSLDVPWPARPTTLRRIDGFLYGASGRAVDVVGAAERWLEGPHGAVLIGPGSFTRGAGPGRTPQPLPVPLLAAPVFFSDDGTRVAGLDALERRVTIALRTREVAAGTGVPIGVDAFLAADGTVHGPGGPWGLGGREGSTAHTGTWLAGPGGRLWSLSTGCPVGPAELVALGVTVAGPDRFVTVDWATHQGWSVPVDDPRRTHPFTLPLDPDDVVIAGCWSDGAAWVRAASGEVLRIAGSEVTVARAEVPERPARVVPSPAGDLVATEVVDLGAHRFVANHDGWLWTLPIGA